MGSFSGDKPIIQALANRLKNGASHGVKVLKNKSIAVSDFLNISKSNGKSLLLLELGLQKIKTGLADNIINIHHPEMQAYEKALLNLINCRVQFKHCLGLKSQIGPRMMELQAARKLLDKLLLKIFDDDLLMLRHSPTMMSPHFENKITQMAHYLRSQG